MSRFAARAVIVALVLLAAIQFVRPPRTNPAIDPEHTLQAQVAASHPAIPVLARACQDCHSNLTTWPWYSRVAPASWLVAHDVTEARTAVNFSEWVRYDAERQRKILRDACDEVTEGEMPPSMYVLAHPEARVTSADVRAVCDLAQMN